MKITPYLVACLALSGCDDVRRSTHHSSSMAPTIAPSAVVTWRELDEPKSIYRKQLVVVRSPLDEVGQVWMMRVVGLEGEVLTLTESGCEIDGTHMTWAQLQIPNPKEQLDIKDHKSTSIPKGSYYLLGDNLSNSRDSREFGPFAEGDIIGEIIEIDGKKLDQHGEGK